MNNENNSNRVYGNPDKYIDVTSRPVLSEEEQKKENLRDSIAARQQRLDQKADGFISRVNQNHGIRGEHAGAMKAIEIDRVAEEEFGYDTRYAARKRVEERIKKSELIQKQTRNLQIKKCATRVIAAALIVSATFAGVVAALHNPMPKELTEETPLEQPIPTEEEFEAGLTEQQLMEKRALDEQANAEIMENLGLEQQSHGRSL